MRRVVDCSYLETQIRRTSLRTQFFLILPNKYYFNKIIVFNITNTHFFQGITNVVVKFKKKHVGKCLSGLKYTCSRKIMYFSRLLAVNDNLTLNALCKKVMLFVAFCTFLKFLTVYCLNKKEQKICMLWDKLGTFCFELLFSDNFTVFFSCSKNVITWKANILAFQQCVSRI